jgi:mannitol/fructose-specific phosphotransferase system IIA component (Ntr-type)
VAVAGLSGAWLARKLRVPGITGNIFIGAVIGLTWFRGRDVPQELLPISTFATALIAVTVGNQFSYRRIRTALNRILTISICESIFAFSAVLAVVLAAGSNWIMAVLLASLAVETAPATTLAVIREARAKGPFVKTVLGVVAFNAGLCITVFGFSQTLAANFFLSGDNHVSLSAAIGTTAVQLLGSIGVGALIGLASERIARVPNLHRFSTVLVAVMACAGIASQLSLSPLIACLTLGICLGNLSRDSERLVQTMEPLEPMLYTCFFTLAGMSIHLDTFRTAGMLCVAYFLARCAGKMTGSLVGARLAQCSPRLVRNMYLTVIPQAGVVIGLLVLLEGDSRIPSEITTAVASLVIAAVTINEIIGPFFTRLALVRVKEAGLDRPRLMEFLQEEFIITNFEAEDKWDALQKLTNFFVSAHRLDKAQAVELYDTIVEREQRQSTAIGHGAAIPHGRLDIADEVQGVLGISRKGIHFDAPDGEPARLIMMIATPTEHEKHHLEVMAGLASMVSDPVVRERLIAAVDPNDAWEIIEEMGARTYNYFLEDVEEEATQS